MNKVLRVSLTVAIILIGSVALIWTGYRFVRTVAWSGDGPFYSKMMGYGDQDSKFVFGMDRGMMGGSAGYDMMNSYDGDNFMMGGFGGNSSGDPLSVEDTLEAVESYLVQFNNDDLVIKEIMIFDNNAYAIIVEESTGIGAFELLVNPQTRNVFPEYGPNMMWNLKYGMMSGAGGYGMMGSGMMGSGMMNGFFNNGAAAGEFDAEMTISAEEALEIAQEFLNQAYPGIEVSDEITQFYGYYTIDTESDGETVGMLSVNGFSRQVFPHVWHGEFIEMVEG